MFSHDFTIILGVRENKKSRTHTKKQFFSRTRYAKFSQALGGPKSRTPQFEGYATFFSRTGYEICKIKKQIA